MTARAPTSSSSLASPHRTSGKAGLRLRATFLNSPQASSQAELANTLRDLYSRQLSETPGDAYLTLHAARPVIETQVKVFDWYRYLLPRQGSILDWGCRHAPDACLMRATYGDSVSLYGCDLDATDCYSAFHRYARLSFQQLNHVFRLPYPDDSFDAVISSGTLEHAAMDYESLKELYRVLKPGGKLVVTYLPNRFSYEEWWRRNIWQAGAHPRLYSAGELRTMLLRTGFRPQHLGYQTRYDCLGTVAPRPRFFRWMARSAQLHRVTSTLCAVGEKVAALM